jgi:hypothetical protein
LEVQQRGAGAITIEVKFPQDFPRTPFFLRVVRPRFVMYTGLSLGFFLIIPYLFYEQEHL